MLKKLHLILKLLRLTAKFVACHGGVFSPEVAAYAHQLTDWLEIVDAILDSTHVFMSIARHIAEWFDLVRILLESIRDR